MADPVVTLLVTNGSEREVVLVLEPVGEIYPMAPDQTRVVRCMGDPAPKLTVEITDAETKIWNEGVGRLELER
jgi:hypothetical protein